MEQWHEDGDGDGDQTYKYITRREVTNEETWVHNERKWC